MTLCAAPLRLFTNGSATYCKLQKGHVGAHRVEYCDQLSHWLDQCDAVRPGYDKGSGAQICLGEKGHIGDYPHFGFDRAPTGQGFLKAVWQDVEPMVLDPQDRRSYIEQARDQLVERLVEKIANGAVFPPGTEDFTAVAEPGGGMTIKINLPEPQQPRSYADRKKRRR